MGDRALRSPGLPQLFGAALAVAVALLILAAPSAAAASHWSPPSSYAPGSWSNSAVLCSFSATGPSVTVSAVNATAFGMWIGMGSVTERSVLGGIGATASLSSAAWTAVNLSTPDVYSLAYSSAVPVLTILGVSLGTANVTVGFSLPETAPGPANSGDIVTTQVTISEWPWQSLFPDLTLNLSLAPAEASGQHLELSTSGGTTVDSMGNASGTPVAYLLAPTTANMSISGGPPEPISIVSTLLDMTAASGTLSVAFGSAAEGASSIGFVAPMTVVPRGSTITIPGPVPVHIPTIDFAAAVGAALIASLAIAGGARRARQSPTDIVYVEEDP